MQVCAHRPMLELFHDARSLIEVVLVRPFRDFTVVRVMKVWNGLGATRASHSAGRGPNPVDTALEAVEPSPVLFQTLGSKAAQTWANPVVNLAACRLDLVEPRPDAARPTPDLAATAPDLAGPTQGCFGRGSEDIHPARKGRCDAMCHRWGIRCSASPLKYLVTNQALMPNSCCICRLAELGQLPSTSRHIGP